MPHANTQLAQHNYQQFFSQSVFDNQYNDQHYGPTQPDHNGGSNY